MPWRPRDHLRRRSAALEADATQDALALDDVSPEQIDVVVITHMHPDHIGGLMTGGNPTFPNARYVTGQAEYDFWADDARAGTPGERVHNLVKAKVVPPDPNRGPF